VNVFEYLKPLSRAEVLAAVAKYPKVRSLAIQATTEWFDSTQSADSVEAEYPFYLGSYADRLSADLREVIKRARSAPHAEHPMMLRLDLVFAYVVGSHHYHGTIRYNLPHGTDITVRVSEQRELKIKHNAVIQKSVADGTEFKEWRRQTTELGFTWVVHKSLTTRTFTQRFWYDCCPLYVEEFAEHLQKVGDYLVDTVRNDRQRWIREPAADFFTEWTKTIQTIVYAHAHEVQTKLFEIRRRVPVEIDHAFTLDYSRRVRQFCQRFDHKELIDLDEYRNELITMFRTIEKDFTGMVAQKFAQHRDVLKDEVPQGAE
jgi:hypothetical protein